MSVTVDARTDQDAAVTAAAAALRDGKLVALPTDTVYGVAADAFNVEGTASVFVAKRRNRSAPLPVLVRSPKQAAGLVTMLPAAADRLMAAYWPGPLTLVVNSEPNLAWDLGDNAGTVAIRMPFDDVTLAVIRQVGPLAVTSANLSGNPAATTAALARTQLGDAVAVYVDGGPRTDVTPSTIVDLTRRTPTILRSGPLDDDEVLAVAAGKIAPHEATSGAPGVTAPATTAGAAASVTLAADQDRSTTGASQDDGDGAPGDPEASGVAEPETAPAVGDTEPVAVPGDRHDDAANRDTPESETIGATADDAGRAFDDSEPMEAEPTDDGPTAGSAGDGTGDGPMAQDGGARRRRAGSPTRHVSRDHRAGR